MNRTDHHHGFAGRDQLLVVFAVPTSTPQPGEGSKAGPRRSIIDPVEPILKELPATYPNLTIDRALQKLQARGFSGKYTVVRQRLTVASARRAGPRAAL